MFSFLSEELSLGTHQNGLRHIRLSGIRIRDHPRTGPELCHYATGADMSDIVHNDTVECR